MQKYLIPRDLALRAQIANGSRTVLTIVFFAAFLCLIQRLTFLLRFPPFQRTAIWTPGAVLFTALLVAPPRSWWMYYVGLCLAAVGAYFDDQVISVSTVLFGVQFLFASMALSAWFIRRRQCDSTFVNPTSFVLFVGCAVVLVPIATEAPQVLVRYVSGKADIGSVALRNVLGIALGVLSGTPALTLTWINYKTWLRALSWIRIFELIALAGCVATVGYFCFGRSIVGSTPAALLYAPLPLLLWAGIRFGLAGVSWALLYVALHATWCALHGRGPFASADPADNILHLQLFLLSVSLPLMFMAVVTEEQQRAFAALSRESAAHKQADERFRLVVESSSSAIVMIDSAGIIILVNAQTEKYFGYSRSDLVGRPIEMLVPERFRPKHSDHRKVFFSSPESRPMGSGHELYGRRNDGSEFPVEISLTPIQTSEGVFCLSSILDISERKRSELARRELAHAARLALIGELSATIAHEINQPLGAILSNADAADILLDSAPEALAEVRQILEDIRKDDLRASNVIQRLRGLARKREIEMRPLDFNEVISDALELLRAESVRRGIVIEMELSNDLPFVCGDKIHLQQVLLNLLLNAMEAMVDSPVPKQLFVRTMTDEMGFVKTTISDTGMGIQADRIDRLFEPFYTTKHEGMGIGLSIARSLIEVHGGRIWAENNPAGGAILHFTLPRGVRHPVVVHSENPPDSTETLA